MKFTESTLLILKNFSEINPSILFAPGSKLRTISPQSTVLAAANLDCEFPSEAVIYELSRFLSTLSLFSDPDIEFKDEKFVIKGGKSKVNYAYAAKNMIMTPPDKDISIENPEATFVVSWEDLQNAIKAASILQLEEIAFKSDGSKLSMMVTDSKNPTSDDYYVEVGECEKSFDITVKSEYLKLLPSNYTVKLSLEGVVEFQSQNVTYWIAAEAK